MGVVFEHLAHDLIRRMVDVHCLGEFDAPVGDLGALQHLAHHFIGVVHFAQPVPQRTEGNFQQVQACRLYVSPLQHTVGNHMQQPTVVANQGQFQAVDQFIGGRVGKQCLHRA
ncbi:hypothetical protein D3C73_1459300 [compost metagenome]